ncbi:MAG TPA: cation transporter [Candidatus Limnocylindrales bacterium]|nr:cation transporter [Candidatus Limnocylindrales bacterium]
MSLATLTRPQLLRRGLRLEYLTVGWNVVEGAIAVGAGLLAGSVALIGFGVDSFVETISGAVLIWRLSSEARGTLDEEAVERIEHRAERFVGVAFLLLAAYVAFEAIRSLVTGEAPDASPVGIALTAVSIGVMLWLARAKRLTGEALGSRALIADARQTAACWYLSVVTLSGLALNAVLGWWWADPVAALGIVVLLVREGLEAIRGEDEDEEDDEAGAADAGAADADGAAGAGREGAS